MKIGFRLHEPIYGTSLGRFAGTTTVIFNAPAANELDFSYDVGGYTGRGSLLSNANFVNIDLQNSYIDGYYHNVKTGFVASRVMIVLGDNEHHITFDELKKKAELGYDELYKAHAADWLNYFDFKPMFSAYAIHAAYKEWQKNPYANIMRYMDICVDVLKFWLSHLVKNGSDGLYYFAQIKDGGESGVDASIDSFTQLDFAKAFLYVGEMYSLFEYTDIGRKMLGALESNRRPDGYLASYKGSPYRFVSPLILYLPRRSCE